MEGKSSTPAEPPPPLWVANLAGALFAVAAIRNAAVSGIFSSNTVALAVLAFVCFQLFVFLKREQAGIGEFNRWLINNAGVLKSGTASFGTVQLDRDTERAQFHGVISFFFFTYTVHRGPMLWAMTRYCVPQ